MRFFFRIFLYLAVIPLSSGGQNLGDAIMGKVQNQKGEGIAYATVALTDARQKILSFAVCREDGKFQLQNVPRGNFKLEISCVGYQRGSFPVEIRAKDIRPDIYVLQEGVELDEAIVSAVRSLVTTQVDRLVYDVENDPDVETANSLQILERVPFIEVSKMDDRIKVMGKEYGFSITIDGKKSLLFSESNQHTAKALAAKRLKRIELVIAPDGKYTDQSAVINIVTKAAFSDGSVGYVAVEGSNEKKLGTNVGLTSKCGRLIYNIAYNYRYSDLHTSRTEIRLTDFKSNAFHYMENEIQKLPGRQNWHKFLVETSYDFSQDDLLTFSFRYEQEKKPLLLASHLEYRNLEEVVTEEIQGATENTTNDKIYMGNLNYQRSFEKKAGRLLTAIYNFDLQKNGSADSERTITRGKLPDKENNVRNSLDNFEHTVAIDFYNPISQKQSYYFTAKYVHRNYTSCTWVNERKQRLLTDRLNYIQQVSSVLGNYSIRGTKLMCTLEGIFEYTFNKIDYYESDASEKNKDKMFLLKLFLSYRPSNKSFFSLNVQRRPFRPDILYLNPYEDRSVSGQILKGNPKLKNEKQYYISLMYRYFIHKKLTLMPIFMYTDSKDGVQQYSFVNEDGTVVTTYDNVAKSQKIGGNLTINYSPFSWLDVRLAGGISRKEYKYSEDRNAYIEQYYSFNLTADLWKGGHFDVLAEYHTPAEWGVGVDMQSKKQHLILDAEATFAQEIGKHWKISVGTKNFWNAYDTRKFEIQNRDFYKFQKEKVRARIFSIRLSYHFGKFGESVKANQRSVENSDRKK